MLMQAFDAHQFDYRKLTHSRRKRLSRIAVVE
jgi:hypothetical protein